MSDCIQNIVIVTWKGGENFGTCLQGYALQERLVSLGYSVCLLPDVPHADGVKSWIQWIMSCVGLMRLRVWLKSKHDFQTNKRMRWERKAYRTLTLWTQWQLRRLVQRTDCFVTGSDQIWNTYHHFMPMQFLNFAGAVVAFVAKSTFPIFVIHANGIGFGLMRRFARCLCEGYGMSPYLMYLVVGTSVFVAGLLLDLPRRMMTTFIRRMVWGRREVI